MFWIYINFSKCLFFGYIENCRIFILFSGKSKLMNRLFVFKKHRQQICNGCNSPSLKVFGFIFKFISHIIN
ncbi:hypothetical protein LDVICp032 [lymphocystis disease virus-China]|uniref:Uncharacterized protein n=1 Tax=lymphocystis disease virus-China TaxID=256729 RepID=Q678H7_9VIRU|nr:hypothetical protein LDVICp032 [lymphocystis disease virus-China]AAU10880.1 hypothetical protein [lymphocystis disease virus-China]